MKRIFIALIIFLLSGLLLTKAYSEIFNRKTPEEARFKLPSGLDLNAHQIVSIKNDIITTYDSRKIEVFQFELLSGKIIHHFTLPDKFDSLLFERYFNDNGREFRTTIRVKAKAGDLKPLVEAPGCFVDDSNRVIIIVYSYKAIPMELPPRFQNMPDQENYGMSRFAILGMIENDSISMPYRIRDSLIGNFFRNDQGSFYKENNSLYFSIAKELENKEPNYFIGKWSPTGGDLHFKEFVKTEIPTANVENKIDYGFLDFIYKKGYLMTYFSPEMYNLNSLTKRRLKLKSYNEITRGDHKKGEVFNIPNTICDFHIGKSTIFVIVRREKEFYLNNFDLNTYEFISETQIDQVTTESLYRFPFFTKDGKIALVKKGPNELVILNPNLQ